MFYLSPDHCPFCIRVELVLGWKKLNYERKVHGYGDFSPEGASGVHPQGKKICPVLEIIDEKTNEKKVSCESMDIIQELESDSSYGMYVCIYTNICKCTNT